jgi:hypothetical protein
MSLSPKISVSEEKNSFNVFDCTGLFSSNNKGGYGVYNPQVKDTTEAFIEVSTPDSGETKYKVDVYPYLPNTDKTGFEVVPLKVGYSDGVLQSGKYTIKFTVIGTYKGKAFTYSVTHVVVFTRAVECCVDARMKELDKNVFKDDKQKKIIELSNLLENVCYQIDCGLYDLANETIEYLKLQCQCCGC